MERKVIGVDFGSSHSSIAIMEIGSTGLPELLNVGGGQDVVTMPTVLALDPNDDTVIAYGNKIKECYRDDDCNVNIVSDFKRELGKSEKANKYCKLFLRILSQQVMDRFNIKEIDSRDYVTCIAHPATWNSEQVELLKTFAEEAGFPSDPDMGIYTVEEPVAAMHTQKVQPSMSFRFGDRPEYYMVIDFGGGTLDICVVKTDILGRTPKIISTSGDPHLGGKEFDEIIEHLFFRNNDNINKKELSKKELAELHNKFQEAKESFSESFSGNNEAPTQSFHISRGRYNLTVSKSEFQNICGDKKIFEKIKTSIHEALDKAHIDIPNIKKVILTGGSSKWFFVREIVAQEFSLGGDSIFLTENPFTDVANGCAIKIGRPDAPPEKKGIWVKIKFNKETKWSSPKCILEPSRRVTSSKEMMHLGTIHGTQYLKPYKIWISWWTGFEENNLESAGDLACIEFYARSNVPFADRMKGVVRALKNQGHMPQLDEYKIYLQYVENSAGEVSYHFEILDATESLKKQRELRKDPLASSLPHGRRECGDVKIGYMSSKGFLGIKYKLVPLEREK